MRWVMADKIGKVRRRKLPDGSERYYLDFRPHGQVFSIPDPGGVQSIPLRDRRMAERLLETIRAVILDGKTLDRALAPYLARTSPQTLIPTKVAHWLETMRAAEEAADLSPTYLRELVRYARSGREFSFWSGRSIYGISSGDLMDWNLWLAKRRLSPKTRQNVLGAFGHSCAGSRSAAISRDCPASPRSGFLSTHPRSLPSNFKRACWKRFRSSGAGPSSPPRG